MNILLIGDIVGSPGRDYFAQAVAKLKKEENIDLVVANAENAAGGKGVTPKIADGLLASGADVITLGDHAWDRKDIINYLAINNRLVRPANYAPGCPGKGYQTFEFNSKKITVVSLVGRVFMQPADCPFRAMDAILSKKVEEIGNIIIVDIHAEATSEKIALGRYLDGRVSVVFGTHTHVQTSDEIILPRGTAYITDVGMTGPKDSVIGRDLDSVLKKFLTGMPSPFKVAEKNIVLEGAIVEINSITGKAKNIKRIRV